MQMQQPKRQLPQELMLRSINYLLDKRKGIALCSSARLVAQMAATPFFPYLTEILGPSPRPQEKILGHAKTIHLSLHP